VETTYEDFTVSVEPGDGDGWHVTARSPAGEDTEMFSLPASMGDVLAPFGQLSRAAETSTVRQARPFRVEGRELRAQDVGETLFRALFNGKIRQLYDRSCGTRLDPLRGLRIRLRFHPEVAAVTRFANLPWELLYDAGTKDFLGLSRRTPVVRYLEVPRAVDTAAVEPPLRVLVVAASPHDAYPLDLDQERRAILAAWPEGGPVEVTFLGHANLDQLHEALQRRPDQRFHVLHFMGHGTFDPATDQGSLLMEDEEGGPRQVSGELLANMLKEELPQLVVLNACESARAGGIDKSGFYAGVASALVLGGVPSVVAMRVPISDRAAILFSRQVYRDLAVGRPIDAAVAEGRLAIYRAMPESLEWATPVLFSRLPGGSLFKIPEERAAAPREEPQPASSGAGAATFNFGTVHANNLAIGNGNQQNIGSVGSGSGAVNVGADSSRRPQ
jgi:CHAT domain